MCICPWTAAWLSDVGSWPFWSDFLPNFAATLTGILLGIPVALWLAGKEARSHASSRRDELKARRTEVSELLRNVLRANAIELRRVHQIILDQESVTDLRLQLEVWRVLRSDVMEVFDSRELRAGLATHFEAVETLARNVSEQASRHLAGLWAPENYQGQRADLIRTVEGDIASVTAARADGEAQTADALADRL